MLNDRIIEQAGDIRELDGRHKSILASIDRLTRKLEQLNYNLSMKDDVSDVLSYILDGAQKATSGRYEKLLTALCQDVLGSRIAIKFVTGTQRDRPTLEIKAVNDGKLEDIFDGRGGSVANIVSTGLRFIVLTRMQELRQFIILDEADCWIRYEIVHKFASIINQMSNDMGVQTLTISHHPKVVFGDANIIKMDYEEAFKRVYVPDEEPFLWEEGKKGIRSIRLHNFMSHQATEIVLGPRNNVIVGGNDIGKSAVVRALRALCYNEGSDDMIRHDTDKCTVTVEIEGGRKISWSRKSKGAHRTEYFMHDSEGNQMHHSVDGKAVPSWVAEAMGVQYVNKFDVQIGHQKKPLFLIDETGSRRAEILSIGRDTQYIQTMCQSYGKTCAENKREANSVHKELVRLRKMKGHLDATMEDLSDSMGGIQSRYNKIVESEGVEKELSEIIAKLKQGVEFKVKPIPIVDTYQLEATDALVKCISSLGMESRMPSLVPIVDTPEMQKTTTLASVVSILSKKAPDKIDLVPEYGFTDNQGLYHVHVLLSAKIPEKVKITTLPKMEKTTALARLIESMKGLSVELSPLKKETDILIDSIKDIDLEIKKVSEKDGRCVMCGNLSHN